MAHNFYAIEITTTEGPVVSRIFQTLKAARKWAAWTSAKWPTRIIYTHESGCGRCIWFAVDHRGGVFGWAKVYGGLRKTRFRGVARTQTAAYIVGAAYNLLRIVNLRRRAT